METKTTDIKRETSLTTFFWWCSGAEVELLRQLPSEKQKYVSIGTTVFLTALLGALSGAYAFISVFQSMFLGVSLGIMWGILIFTLDRYAVSAVAKSSSPLKTLLSSFPSLLISVIISIVISTPLSLRIFEKQIQLEQTEQVHQSIFSVNSEYGKQQKIIQAQIDTLQSEIHQKQAEVFLREREFMNEMSGANGSRIQGYGAIADFKRNLFDDARRDYTITKAHNDSLISSLNTQIVSLNEKMSLTAKLYSSQLTFIDMIQAFTSLREKNNTIYLASIFLMLIFILVSTAPIFIQILSMEGPYNDYVQIRDKIQNNRFFVSEQEQQNDGNELKLEVEELKKKFDDFSTVKIDKMINELVEQKKPSHQNITFQSYFNKMLDTLSNEADKIEKKAKDFFWQGMVFSIMGILVASGFLVFWINYFSIKRFELYDIFELISGTIIILLIEFLGAWFLKQYKVLSEKSLHILKIKSSLDRYLLSYLAINEFATSDKRESYLNQLLSTLDKDLRFPPDPSTSHDTSFAQEAFSSISNLTDTIKNISKIK
jgi:hypothetical protein